MLKSKRDRTLILRIDADSNQDLDALLREVARRGYRFLKEDPESQAETFIRETYCSGDYSLTIREGDTILEEPGDIDRKYEITARSRHSGIVYTHAHGVFFKAEDEALPGALRGYKVALMDKGAGEPQIDAVILLGDRVREYQKKHGVKLPDVDPDNESYLLTKDGPGEAPAVPSKTLCYDYRGDNLASFCMKYSPDNPPEEGSLTLNPNLVTCEDCMSMIATTTDHNITDRREQYEQ